MDLNGLCFYEKKSFSWFEFATIMEFIDNILDNFVPL